MSEKKRRGIATWFREMKSELKKVVWPSLTQVYKNTVIVLVVCAVFAVITGLMDLVLKLGVSFLHKI
ncbi:MAG: preprotein translocase subunit SecE [Oscillospiraceae bacterium]|nr:preprotein translocase subunit SecE [Oscillospiraceae bacterium]MBQ4544103.1 preprotein translocase subunit SecE [Oscillospiraceae bacterium]MBQ6901807.1 preprotein translocase subunit SecE [Oscillospiraceae bacterium]